MFYAFIIFLKWRNGFKSNWILSLFLICCPWHICTVLVRIQVWCISHEYFLDNFVFDLHRLRKILIATICICDSNIFMGLLFVVTVIHLQVGIIFKKVLLTLSLCVMYTCMFWFLCFTYEIVVTYIICKRKVFRDIF